MELVVDASVVIACINDEPERDAVLATIQDYSLIAPASLVYEIGKPFSAMFKRRRIKLDAALSGMRLYYKLPIALKNFDLTAAIRLSELLDIYAYDAYLLQCAIENRADLFTLDRGLISAAGKIGVVVREVQR